MSVLSLRLPPLASDYSGACSALFEFDSLAVINDAHCCTMSYTEYDEPRWKLYRKPVLCTKLRTIDAVLGDDGKVVGQIVQAAADIRPDFTAVLGSPVPAIIGMDAEGIASEVESRSGLPCLAFSTTGFSAYHVGVALAAEALIRRYAERDAVPFGSSVNLLGLTPLDFSLDEGASLARFLARDGWDVNASLFSGCGLDQVRRIGFASVNLVVSAAGLPTARLLQGMFGTPFVAACPIGRRHGEHVLRLLRQTAADGAVRYSAPLQGVGRGALVVHDPVVAASFACALGMEGGASASPATLVPVDERELEPLGVAPIPDERSLVEMLESGSYRVVVGDPLLGRLPHAHVAFVDMWHPALSSRLSWGKAPALSGEEGDALVARAATELAKVRRAAG